MSGKPKLAMYWAASCGGCDIAVLNINEMILDVDANFEVVFWPVVMDAKVKDVEAMPDQSIFLTLFSGSMRNADNVTMAKLLRRKSQILVSFGSCAGEGCIPGLANLSPLSEIFDASYQGLTTENPNNIRPQAQTTVLEGGLHIPEILPVLHTLDSVVPVDYTMPGCPPESHQIAAVLSLIIDVLQGQAELPPKGAVIGAGKSTVCDECPRSRNLKTIKQFVRVQDVVIDPQLCLLEQGIPCNGPATRSGCGCLCPQAGAQCIGCYGPAQSADSIGRNSVDFGARLMTAFASVIDSKDPAEIDRILDGIPDPAGQFYRFNLAGSLLHASRSALQIPLGESTPRTH